MFETVELCPKCMALMLFEPGTLEELTKCFCLACRAKVRAAENMRDRPEDEEGFVQFKDAPTDSDKASAKYKRRKR